MFSRFSRAVRSSARRCACILFLATTVPGLAADVARKPFDIPAAAAEQSLKQFAAQAGVEVLFSTEAASGVRTNPVKGDLTPLEAVTQLVAGTRLVAVPDSKNGIIRISRSPDPNVPRAAPPANGARPATPDEKNPPPGGASARAKTVDASQETTVELPPFEVRTDLDTGYVAQNTTAGSRLNTDLKDLGAAISVFTAEFLNDIGATNLTDLSQYTVNTARVDGMVGDVANGNEFAIGDTSFRVRGLPTAGRMVNYFTRLTEVDTFNTERVEFSRGPNAVLFGLGQAGGAFNVATKKADLRRDRYTASIRAGDFDALRITTDLNESLVRDKLAVRLNLARDTKEAWRPNEFRDQERLDFTTQWRIAPKTHLNLEYETGHIEATVQRPWTSFDSFTFWNSLGRPLDTVAGAGVSPGTLNLGGVYYVYDSTSNRVMNFSNQSRSAQTPAPGTADSTPTANPLVTDFSLIPKRATISGKGVGIAQDLRHFTATLQHELVRDLFVELAYNRQETGIFGRDIANNELRINWDTSPTLPVGPGIPAGTPNPYARQPYMEGHMIGRNRLDNAETARLTSSYEFGTGRLQKFLGRHRVAGLYQREEIRTRVLTTEERIVGNPPNTVQPDNFNNTLRRRTYVDLGGPVEAIALADFRALPLVNFTDSSRGVPISAAMVPVSATDDKRVVASRMVVAQSRFLTNRLVTTFGYRIDKVSTYRGATLRGAPYAPFAQGELYAVPGDTATKQEGRTQTSGGVFHVTRHISGFYNQSKSFSTASLSQRIAREDPAPSPTGTGRDYGLKVSLLEGKLFATFSAYETAARRDNASLNTTFSNANLNLIWNALEAAGVLASRSIAIETVRVNLNAYTFDSDSKGYEFELVANPLPGWRVSLNAADTKTIQTNTAKELLAYVDEHRALWTQHAGLTAGTATIGELLAIFDEDAVNRFQRPDGAMKMGDSRYSANLRTNYTFRETFLRGFGAGFGVRWRGAPVLGYTSTNPATRRALKGDETLLADANFSYRLNRPLFGRRFDVELQLNVNNLFEEDDIVPTRLFDNGQIRTYRLQTPREIFVTTTVRF